MSTEQQSDQGLFKTQQEQSEQTTGQQQVQQEQQSSGVELFTDQLKSIVNEEGNPKYGSVEEALKALQHSQNHIKTLETESASKEEQLRKLQEELAGKQAVEEVVERISANQQQQQETPVSSGLDEDAVLNLVNQTISKKREQEVVQSNVDKVSQAMINSYGDKAQEVINNKAKEINTTPEALGELAKTQPDLVLSLFNKQGGGISHNPSTSTINLRNTQPKQDEVPTPKRSMLVGATTKDQAEYMRQVKENVYKRLGVEN